VTWWLISHYLSPSPSQVHLVQIKELTVYPCRHIAISFARRHPGYYLFIFTKDYSYLVFMAIEWSRERKPSPGRLVWPFWLKPYYFYLLINRHAPTENDIIVLNWLSLDYFRYHPTDYLRKGASSTKIIPSFTPGMVYALLLHTRRHPSISGGSGKYCHRPPSPAE